MKIIPQPYHPGRWIIVDADGQSMNAISYPSEDAARKAIFDPDGNFPSELQEEAEHLGLDRPRT